MNQASDLQNINLLPSGGFTKRFGNSAFNASAMVGATTPISGLGYLRTAAGVEYLVAVAGTKIFESTSLDGTMHDITGSVSVTAGQDNIWTSATMNNLIIFVGGVPDAPFTYSGSGNCAALAGSPPSGSFIITANNRAFIGNTASNPSRIAWSILGSPSDWTGAGSGSQDVQANDGDTLVGAAQQGPNHLLLFKQNSIHDLVISSSPFPLFPLFRGVGAVSKRGIVTADGVTYFITPQARMKATNGLSIFDAANPGPTGITDKIDATWDGLNKARLRFIHGIYYQKLHQIMWFCSDGTATTHNLCIIWDLVRKCWLQHRTGFSMNTSTIAHDYLLYTGAYDGKVYLQDDATTNNDASESASIINGYWRSGWMDFEEMIQSKSPVYGDLNFETQTSGSFIFSYGFDFSQDRKSEVISVAAPGAMYNSAIYDVDMFGGLSDKAKLVFMKGNGKFFQFLLKNANNGEAFTFNRMEIPIKSLAPTAAR